MLLDIGWIAEDLNPTGSGGVFSHVHWAAAIQPIVISCGSVVRFVANDLRPDKNGARPTGWYAFKMVALFVAAFCFWVVASFDVLHRVGYPMQDSYKWTLWAVVCVQIGYPVVAIFQMYWLNFRSVDPVSSKQCPHHHKGMPGNQYDPFVSFVKDFSYGFLDVTSKGGLAMLCAIRAADYE